MSFRRQHPSRIVSLILLILPLIALLELSGFAHSAADFVEVVVAGGHHVSDCDDEQGGLPCDPGCAGCHCGHGGPTVASPHLSVVALHATTELGLRAPEDLRAPSPERVPPFRPPRLG